MTDDDDLPIQSSRPSRALRRRSVPTIPLNRPAPSFAPEQPAAVPTHIPDVDQRDERLSRAAQETSTTNVSINIRGLVSALASTLPERETCYRHLATLAQQFNGGPFVVLGSTKAVRIGLKPDSIQEGQLETPPRAR